MPAVRDLSEKEDVTLRHLDEGFASGDAPSANAAPPGLEDSDHETRLRAEIERRAAKRAHGKTVRDRGCESAADRAVKCRSKSRVVVCDTRHGPGSRVRSDLAGTVVFASFLLGEA